MTRSKAAEQRRDRRPSRRGASRDRKSRGGRPGARARSPVRRLVSTDRIYLVYLLLLVVLLGAMAAGPVGDYVAAEDRVDELTAQRDALESAVHELEGAEEDLQDPERLELLARTELGLVRPGEIPYVMVTPEAGPALRDAAPPPPAPAPIPWYQRFGRMLLGLLE